MAWDWRLYRRNGKRVGCNRLNQMLMNPDEKFFSTLNLAFEKI